MDFSYTAQEEQFRMEFRTWLESNLPEGWLDGTFEIPKDEEQLGVFLRQWQKTLLEGRWAAIAWPEQFGGRNATLMEEIIYHQELVRVKAPEVVNYIGLHMVGPTLMQVGTPEQQERYIPKILNAEEVWCQGYSEPNAGSDLAGVQTTAVKKGDKWIINGQKIWTTYAHFADRIFLVTRTSKGEKKHHGITCFLVDMNQPGVEVRPIIQMNGAHEFNEVYLTDAIAYDSEVVGRVDDGWRVTMALLMHERTGIGTEAFRLEKQFEELTKLAQNVMEDGVPLMEKGDVQKRLLNLYIKSRGALLNYYRNLTAQLKVGYPSVESSIDKLIVTELYKELTSEAISILGHQGLLWKKDAIYGKSLWQKNFLMSFGLTIGGGSSEMQKNTIAERILGLPKDAGR